MVCLVRKATKPSNPEIVRRAVELCAEMGRRVASAEQAARLLDLPR